MAHEIFSIPGFEKSITDRLTARGRAYYAVYIFPNTPEEKMLMFDGKRIFASVGAAKTSITREIEVMFRMFYSHDIIDKKMVPVNQFIFDYMCKIPELVTDNGGYRTGIMTNWLNKNIKIISKDLFDRNILEIREL